MPPVSLRRPFFLWTFSIAHQKVNEKGACSLSRKFSLRFVPRGTFYSLFGWQFCGVLHGTFSFLPAGDSRMAFAFLFFQVITVFGRRRKKHGQPMHAACIHYNTKSGGECSTWNIPRRFLQPPAFAGDSFIGKVFTCGSFSRPTFAGEPFTYEFFTYEKSIASPCPFLPCPLGALLTAGLFAVQRPVRQPFSRLQVARPNGPFAFPPRSEHLPQEELFTGMRTRYSI